MVNGLKFKFILALVLFCITVFLLSLDEYRPYGINYNEASKEMFIPQLRRLNSIDRVVNYTDSVYGVLQLSKFDTSRYVRIVSGTVKRRFYHGISNYSLSENWIVYVLGKTCWSHISAIVNPDDILKHPEGLCSQQNIVFMEVLKRKSITTRAVGLGTAEGPGHFLSEVLYDNKWHLFDVDVEPNWKATTFNHESLEILLANKEELYKIYKGRLTTATIDKIVGKIKYGEPNSFPATKMLIFQKAAKVFTYILPIFFLLMFIWYYRKYKTSL